MVGATYPFTRQNSARSAVAASVAADCTRVGASATVEKSCWTSLAQSSIGFSEVRCGIGTIGTDSPKEQSGARQMISAMQNAVRFMNVPQNLRAPARSRAIALGHSGVSSDLQSSAQYLPVP